MPKRPLQDARLIALFILGCFVLTYPLLSLFSRDVTFFGIPLLYAYLYGAWLALIVLAGLVARH